MQGAKTEPRSSAQSVFLVGYLNDLCAVISCANAHRKQLCCRADFCLAAWVVGVCSPLVQAHFIADFWSSTWWVWMIGVFGLWVCPKEVRRNSVFVVFFALGAFHANHQLLLHKKAILEPAFESISLGVSGVIVGLPKKDQSRVKFDFRVDQAPAGLDLLLGQRLRLNCYRCTFEIAPDQRWKLTVRLKRPRGFASWGAFDYEKYLFRHRIVATGYVRLQEHNELLGLVKPGIHSWRAKLSETFTGMLGSDGAGSAGSGMFMALMLGDRSMLTTDQRNVFQVTGVSHLMAISGLHVGLMFMLAAGLGRLLLWPIAGVFNFIPRQQLVLLPALLTAFGYAALAGFAISTQRAMVMLCVYALCRVCARQLSLLQVLQLAMVALLLYDPFAVLDTGFWLSCFAVLLIGVANHKYTNLTLWQLQPWLWLGMLPVTALFFGQISLISPIVNLLIVPLFCLFLIPLVLLAMSLMLAEVSLLAGPLTSLLVYGFDWVFEALAWIGSQPFAFVYPESLAVWQAAILVLALLISLSCWRLLPIFLALSVAWLWPSPPSMDESEYQVTLLDVGQGLSMVVELQGYVLVYDTGPGFVTGFNTADAVLLPYLRARGIQRIDHLIVSHADNDHIGGLGAIVKALPVGGISTSRMDKMPIGAINKSRPCQIGQVWYVAKVRFEILSPSAETPKGSNNLSCVLAIDNGQLRTLITGDIEKPVEKHLLATNANRLAADVMLVPHQGSKTSSTEGFLDAVQPQLALLAAGYNNHYGHPHDEVVRRYFEREIELLSTVDNGSIRLIMNKDGWRVERFRQMFPRVWRS